MCILWIITCCWLSTYMRSNSWSDRYWSFINTRSTTSALWAFGDMCSLFCNKTMLDEKKHVNIWRSYIRWTLEAAEQIDTIIKNILSSFSFSISKKCSFVMTSNTMTVICPLHELPQVCVCVNPLALVCRCPLEVCQNIDTKIYRTISSWGTLSIHWRKISIFTNGEKNSLFTWLSFMWNWLTVFCNSC